MTARDGRLVLVVVLLPFLHTCSCDRGEFVLFTNGERNNLCRWSGPKSTHKKKTCRIYVFNHGLEYSRFCISTVWSFNCWFKWWMQVERGGEGECCACCHVTRSGASLWRPYNFRKIFFWGSASQEIAQFWPVDPHGVNNTTTNVKQISFSDNHECKNKIRNSMQHRMFFFMIY